MVRQEMQTAKNKFCLRQKAALKIVLLDTMPTAVGFNRFGKLFIAPARGEFVSKAIFGNKLFFVGVDFFVLTISPII